MESDFARVAVLTNAHRFFATPPLKIWCLIHLPLYLMTLKYGGCDGIQLPRLGHKGHCSLPLLFPLKLLLWEKAAISPWEHFTAQRLCSVKRSMLLETEASSQQPCHSEPSWKLTLQLQTSLQITEVLTDMLTINPQEVLGQDHRTKLLPNSWSTETVR